MSEFENRIQRRMLSRTERAVLVELAGGKTVKEIAATFGRSTKTAECHVLNLRRKLGARTLAHAVFLGLLEGIIPFAPID
jgi:LuxR family transcriptional regulator, activator of conjugal transfer of Ti plasmids